MEQHLDLLRLFERCRITNGHSPETFWRQLNPRETATLPLEEFASNVVAYFGFGTGSTAISLDRARELARFFVGEGGGEIGQRDVRRTLRRFKTVLSVGQLLELHPNTTPYLAGREDFQAYYSEWNAENGVPPLCLVEAALRLTGEERRTGDLQVIYKWLKQKKILVHVHNARLLAVCRTVHIFDCPMGTVVVKQGDPGDAFYIVLCGLLDIDISGVVVATIGAGTLFGEKALENNAPRAATVTAKAPCILMVLMASEYQHLAATAQFKEKQDLIEFLTLRCQVMRSISRTRLFYLVKSVAKQSLKKGDVVFHQGGVASALYVVKTGNISVIRRVSPLQSPPPPLPPNPMLPANDANKVEDEGGGEPQECGGGVHRQQVPSVVITIREMAPGDFLGDDCLRSADLGRNVHSNTAVVNSDTASVIMINRAEVRQYFTRGKAEALGRLIEACRDLHRSDEALLEEHNTNISQQRLLQSLRGSAYGEAYRERIAYGRALLLTDGSEQGLNSRFMSTASLQRKERENKTIVAQIEYAQKAVSLTQHKFFSRRDSVAAISARRASVTGRRGSVAAQPDPVV